MIYLSAFFISMVYVGLRSFQQLNVMHSKYAWVPVVSMLMAFADYWMINAIVQSTPAIAVSIGLGGATGACISMAIYPSHKSNGTV